MNEELRRLLSEAGVPAEVGWQDLIIVQNVAGVPPPAMHAGIWPWDRGFNFVVLDGGTPKFFGKCRPAGDELLERETSIRSCLAQNHSGSLSVPPAWMAASERIAVQLSPFMRGSHYGRVAPRQSTNEYLATVRTVLTGVGELADHAQRECESVPAKGPALDLRASAREGMEYAASQLRSDTGLLSALSTALSAARTVPSRPQHGDLWPPNVLIGEGHLWALDLEDWGTVRCPLYDDLTLLRASLALRPGPPGSGIERLASSELEAVALREILAARAASEGIDPSQLDGVLAFYVTHRAFNVKRRAGSWASGKHVDDVRYVAERLAGGQRGLLSPE